MSIRWDKRNKRWRYEFDKIVEGGRKRSSRLLPKGWSRSQADAYDIKETGRLYAIACGVERADPLIDEAVILYLQDKSDAKAFKATAQHLGAIAWAYTGKPMSELGAVAKKIRDNSPSASTARNRIACLKAAARWGWRQHGLVSADPTSTMLLPSVRNERHTYISRAEMLKACRACDNWSAQIAIRVSFYSGLRLGEILRADSDGESLVLEDTKNGDRRIVPAHPRIRHLLRFLPLPGPKITIQRAWERARARVGLGHVHFHDLRHSAASEMANAGIDLYTIGRVLGHRDGRSTARYSHLRPDTLAAAVGKIGKRA